MTTIEWNGTWHKPNPRHSPEETNCFLKGLRLGDRLKIHHNNYLEEMSVIREVKKEGGGRPRVAVKRPHLVVPVILSESDGYLLFRWSAKIGNENCDWSDWTIERGDLTYKGNDLPRPAPSPPPTPCSIDFGATPDIIRQKGMKKGRGRPRKIDSPSTPDLDSTTFTLGEPAVPLKNPRGRPKKVDSLPGPPADSTPLHTLPKV